MVDLWEQMPLLSRLCHWLKTHISITAKLHSRITVEPQCNEGPRDFQNLFAIIFHIFYYYWGNENRLLYWGLCHYRGSTVFTPTAGLSLRLHVAGYMQLVDGEFEQLGSSSGSIFLFCPMKVVGSHAHRSQGEIPGSHPLVTALQGLQYYRIEINRDIL